MNLLLCLDTIGPHAGVTVIKGQQAHHEPLNAMQASERLLETIDGALTRIESKLADLEGVLVIKGPGSFTGLRVGIAIANQFAHQLKIPIIGFRAEEWWKHRTAEKDFLYLQTMNRGEVYATGFGKLERPEFPSIIPVETLVRWKADSSITGLIKWLGVLSEEHRKLLSSNFEETSELETVENTWRKAAQSIGSIDWQTYRDYQLIEPFYGKAPNITVSARK